jgi:hypothetical protein
MDVRSPIAFVQLGAYLRDLSGRTADDRVDGDGRILATLGRLELELRRLGFRVAHQLYVAQLAPIVDQLHRMVEAHPESPTLLTVGLAGQLRREMESLERTVFAECGTRMIAVPTNRRFDFEVLVRDPASLFAENVIALLPEIARTDIIAACRCIAFDCPTASAFHVLRCIEECVRMVYRAYFPNGNDSRPWGPLCQDLANKQRAPRPEPILLTRLNDLRAQFRNPTQHPEKNYQLDEAQDLLHLAIELLPRCVNDQRVVARRR